MEGHARAGAPKAEGPERGALHQALRPVGSWRAAAAGSLAWACAMAGSAALADGRITGWIDPHLSEILLVYFLGGLAAFVPAVAAAGLAAGGKREEARFAAAVVALVLCTVAATGAVYGFQHMRDDIDWTGFPGPAFAFMDIPESMVGALVHYLVLGVRLLAPEGIVPLLLASLWIARRLR